MNTNVPHIIREHCKTCNRAFIPEEGTAGLCPVCLEARANDLLTRFNPNEFRQGPITGCFECKKPLLFGGYMHWDRTAASFCVLCVSCSDKKVQADAQFRNTPFAYQQKVQ